MLSLFCKERSHVIKGLWYNIYSAHMSPFFCLSACVLIFHTELGAHLVVSPETCQSIGVDHPKHQAVLVLPSDVILVTVVAQQLIHIVPQQSALYSCLKHQEDTCCQNLYYYHTNIYWYSKLY